MPKRISCTCEVCDKCRKAAANKRWYAALTDEEKTQYLEKSRTRYLNRTSSQKEAYAVQQKQVYEQLDTESLGALREYQKVGARKRRSQLSPEQLEAVRLYQRNYQREWRERMTAQEHERVKATGRAYQASPKGQISRRRSKGITDPERFSELFDAQGAMCGICRSTTPRGGQRRWCADHDHVSGKMRGVLCHMCNTAIGVLGDNEEGLLRALRYLQHGSV